MIHVNLVERPVCACGCGRAVVRIGSRSKTWAIYAENACRQRIYSQRQNAAAGGNAWNQAKRAGGWAKLRALQQAAPGPIDRLIEALQEEAQ